ncbi:MAG: fibrobacter succinogenes major paralogous domain-containing protein, partial [Prevotellaceae bacterium]|nr:fibrobacter succinogenes major paralogous domain-containing protein [Prevotellaceae bacterium]
ASTRTWAFGGQTWSDAIHVPGCNKTSFTNSYTGPQCRSYTKNGKTRYYYNWAYVNINKNRLCPLPWRVPTKNDLDSLVGNTSDEAFIAAWGYGGFIESDVIYDEHSYAYYWSFTMVSSYISNAYYLLYPSRNMRVRAYDKRLGFQVRCLR